MHKTNRGDKDMIVPNYYEDLHTHHDNAMPNRAYYIPASKRFDQAAEHRELSDRFQLMTLAASTRFLFPVCGRITVMTATSIPISATRFLPILPLCRRITLAALICTPLRIKKMMQRPSLL